MDSSAEEPTLLAADSFRVRERDGVTEVRGLHLHLERFRWAVTSALAARSGSREEPPAARSMRSARAAAASALLTPLTEASEPFLVGAGPDSSGWLIGEPPLSPADSEALSAFLADARAKIAGYGEGFPRLELWRGADGSARYGCSLRPLPELSETIELRSSVGDPPPHSHTKGPNIGRYAVLNRELGAEALLVDGDGLVREGATTSFIVWPYEQDTGGCVIDHADRVASITEQLISSAANSRLIGEKPGRRRTGALGHASLTVDALQRCEVWAVNALHGIRPVTHIDGGEQHQPVSRRLRWFREALDRTWEPLDF